jgi:hypothetical protein
MLTQFSYISREVFLRQSRVSGGFGVKSDPKTAGTAVL